MSQSHATPLVESVLFLWIRLRKPRTERIEDTTLPASLCPVACPVEGPGPFVSTGQKESRTNSHRDSTFHPHFSNKSFLRCLGFLSILVVRVL